MKKFILRLFFLTATLFLIFEILIRIFKLTNDVPSRRIDDVGLQSFIPLQKGIYENNRWEVNEYGFLGQSPKKKLKNSILIIGDSMIENIMNPNSCHLDVILNKSFKNKINFFEVGRSGMTLIESLEFNKKYKSLLNPIFSIIYVNQNDIEESISNLYRHKDRLQINLKTSKLEPVEIKYEKLKYILYNLKSLYYLYMKGFFSNIRLFKDPFKSINRLVLNENFNKRYLEDFFSIIKTNYQLENIFFLIDKKEKTYVDNFQKNKLNIISFSSNQNWLNKKDFHWNCFGNREVSKIIKKHLKGSRYFKSY